MTDIYDLSDVCNAVWHNVNAYSENEPTADELADIRAIIKAHYELLAQRLAEGRQVRLDDCGTYTLKLRAGRQVQNFQTGERYEIPDFLEVEFNAAPHLEGIIGNLLKPPAPEVK